MSVPMRTILRSLVVPLAITAITGFVFFNAGSSYQTFGLAALDSSREVISHALGITLFLSFGVLLDRMVRHLILDGVVSNTQGTPVPGLLKQFSSIIIFLVIGAIILSVVFKKDLTVLWAASGVAGIVLGLALQTLLQDIYSGLALNIDRPLKIGDSIQIDVGTLVRGEVKEISWRTTHILDKSNNTIVLPNNRVAAATITNFSEAKNHSLDFREITIDAMIPHERVLRILMAAAVEACSLFASEKDPAPRVLVWDLSPLGVVYRVHYFVGMWQKDTAQSLVLQCVLNHLRQGGLRPAMPKLEHTTLINGSWLGNVPSPRETAAVLSACPLLSGLTEAELTLFAAKSQVRMVPEEYVLLNAGETGTSAFVLIEGLVTAVRMRGTPRFSKTLRPGDCFGFEAALLGDPYPETIRTRTAVIVCEMDTATFSALFSAHPDTVAMLSNNLAANAPTTEEPKTITLTDQEYIISDIERSIKRNFAAAFRKGRG